MGWALSCRKKGQPSWVAEMGESLEGKEARRWSCRGSSGLAGSSRGSLVKYCSPHEPGRAWPPWEGCVEVTVPEGDICLSTSVSSQAEQERLWGGSEPRDQKWEVMVA